VNFLGEEGQGRVARPTALPGTSGSWPWRTHGIRTTSSAATGTSARAP